MKSKFSVLRSIRRKEFDAENYITKPFAFNGKQKSVYENANLSIFVNESCNADCRFCIDQLRFEGKGKTFIKERISDDEEYFTRLAEVLETIRPLNPSISTLVGSQLNPIDYCVS